MKVSSGVGRKCAFAWLVLLVVCSVEVEGSSKNAKDAGVNANVNAIKANKPLQFASPLQTLTLFPKSSESESESESTRMSPRKAFLPKFVAGLSAERRMKEKLSSQRKELLLASLNDDVDVDNSENENESGNGNKEESLYSNDWDKRSEAADRQRLKMEGLRMERAHDRAIAKYEQQLTNKPSTATNNNNRNNPYQFVGVIHSSNQKNTNNEKQEIQWFARKKKNPDSWNVRLVHVNKDALLRDLFVRGKVDIYGEYINTGNFITENTKNNDNQDTQTQPSSPQFGRPLLQTKYSVKPRSWRYVLFNLSNLSS